MFTFNDDVKLGGTLEDFKRWGLIDLIPDDVILEVTSSKEKPYIWVMSDISYDLTDANWDTHREYVHTKVLKESDIFVLFQEDRCTVRTNEQHVQSRSIWCKPERRIIHTNASLPDCDHSVYVEAYGDFPEGEWLSPEFMKNLGKPRRVWDRFGNELPPDTKVQANLQLWHIQHLQ